MQLYILDGIGVEGTVETVQVVYIVNGKSIVKNQVLVGRSSPDIHSCRPFVGGTYTRHQLKSSHDVLLSDVGQDLQGNGRHLYFLFDGRLLQGLVVFPAIHKHLRDANALQFHFNKQGRILLLGSQFDLLGVISKVGNHDHGSISRDLFQGKMTILVAGDPFGGSLHHDGGKRNPLSIVTVSNFAREEKVSLDRLQCFSGLLLLLLNNLLVLKQLVQLLLVAGDVDESVFPDQGDHVPGGGEHF